MTNSPLGRAKPRALIELPSFCQANRITELRAGALHDLDAAFGVERAHYCGTLS